MTWEYAPPNGLDEIDFARKCANENPAEYMDWYLSLLAQWMGMEPPAFPQADDI